MLRSNAKQCEAMRSKPYFNLNKGLSRAFIFPCFAANNMLRSNAKQAIFLITQSTNVPNINLK
jgi:hypothetical protein